MAITIGNTSNSTAVTGAGPFTWSHDSNGTFLVVAVAYRDNADNTLSATYNGVSMTSATSRITSGGSVLEAQIFYLINPASGSNTVSVSTSGSIGDVLGAGAVSLSGVDWANPIDATASDGQTPGSEDPRSTNITTTVANALIIDCIADRAADSVVVSGQTGIFSLGTGDVMGGSYKAATTAGVYSMGWNPSAGEAGEDWSQVIIALKPLDATATIQNKSSNAVAAASSSTHAHIVSTGLTNSGLLVLTGSYDNTTPADAEVTGVTYNGDAMTKLIGVYSDPSNDADEYLAAWYLANPDVGSNNVVVTATGSVPDLNVHVMTLANVAQAGQPDSTSSDGDDDVTTFDVATTTNEDNCYVFSLCSSRDFGSTVADGAQTTLASLSSGFWVSSYSLKSTAGAVNHSYSNGHTDDAHLIAVSIKPYTEPPANTAVGSYYGPSGYF